MAIQTIKKLEDYVLTNPAGLQGEIQFNNGGSFDTNSTFVYDTSTNRVGIGVSSPNEKLVVAGAIRSTSNAVDWAASDGSIIDYLNGDTRIVAARNGANSSNMTFTTYNAGVAGERVRIDPLGNLGIGTDSPSSLAHVYNGTLQIGSKTGDTSLQDNQIAIRIAAIPNESTEWGGIQWYREFSDFIGAAITAARPDTSESKTELIFKTTDSAADATEKMRITSAGNVSVNDTHNTAFMNTATAGRYIGVASNNSDALFIAHSSGQGVGYFGYDNSDDRLIIATDNGGGGNSIQFSVNAGSTSTGAFDNLAAATAAMTIANNGDVGIGTDNPGSPLDVRGGNVRIDGGSVTDRNLYFRNQSTGTVGGSVRSDQTLSLFAGVGGAPTQAVTIERETLNVGIGEDAPTATLVAQAASNTLHVFKIQNAAGQSVTESYINGSGEPSLSLRNASGVQKIQLSTHEPTYFNTGQNFGIGTTAPSTNLHIQSTDSEHLTILRGFDINGAVSEQRAVIRGGAIDSSGNPEIGASIGLGIYDVDGLGVGTDLGGSIRFNTRNNGGSTPTEKMRINSDGSIVRNASGGAGISYEFVHSEATTTDLSVDITVETSASHWHSYGVEARVSYVNNNTPRGIATFLIFVDGFNGSIFHISDAVQGSAGTVPTLSVSISGETMTLTFNTWDGAAVAHRAIGHFRVLTTFGNVTHS